MYTRSWYRGQRGDDQRYSPPPGYVGTAFSDESSVKHHIPEKDVHELPQRMTENSPDTHAVNAEVCVFGEEASAKNNGGELSASEACREEKSPLVQLAESMRGRIGKEELIILMTMLLISSDGVGAEVLILALALLAGKSEK